MKDSEVEWIGEIPNLWNIARIKDVSLVSPICDFSKINNDDLITYSPMECIKSGFFINKSARYDSLPKSLTPFQNGDIVLAKVTPCFENGNISIMDNLYSKVGLGSSELFVFRCKNVLTKFLFYVLQNDSFKQLGKASMTGIAGLKRISSDFCKNFKICLPPIEEQQKIADFLDGKCSTINTLIEKTKFSIEEYKKLKQAVITQAVTKGIRPNREMKDSEVEWIGEIPSEWEFKPLFCYFGERNNKNKDCKEENLLSLSYGKIVRKNINTTEGLLPKSFDTYNIVEKDDIVIRPTDLQNDKKSLRTGLVKEHGIITSAYITLKPIKKLDSRFFSYLLHSYDCKKVFYNMGNGVRQGLNFSLFSKLKVGFPSMYEQQEIAEYLDKKCADIDTLISKKQKLVEELENYKKSLIYEYVTGKKEVE